MTRQSCLSGAVMFATTLVFALLSLGSAIAASQHFIQIVSGVAAPADYRTIVQFNTPSGVGIDRTAVIKIMTVNPAALQFQLEPPTPGQTGTRSPLNFQADGVGTTLQEKDVAQNPTAIVASAVIAEDMTAILPNSPSPSPPAPANLKMLRITIQYDDGYNFTIAETWKLKVMESTSNQQYFGFVGATEAEATQPKIGIVNASTGAVATSGTLDFKEVQINLPVNIAPVDKVDIRNIGTDTLTFNSLSITGPKSAVFTVQITNVQLGDLKLDPAESLPNEFNENSNPPAVKGIWIGANPKDLGPANATLALSAGADSANVNLVTSGINLYAHMVLDVSGSMGWKPNGGFTTVETEQRLWLLKDAGKKIAHWVNDFSGGQAYLGLTTFPDTSVKPYIDDGKLLSPIDTINNNLPGIIFSMGGQAVGGLSPGVDTPMEAGVKVALADMNAHRSADGGTRLRQAMLLMTDGKQNIGDVRNQINPLKNAGIRMYTVGYGIPGTQDVDQSLLQQLASSTGGSFIDANALDVFAVKDAFKKAVQPWLNLRAVVDPTGQIRRGQSRSHDVCIDSDAYAVTFAVDWNRPQAGAINVSLVTPKGEVITPASPDVSFQQSDTFAMYVIHGKRMRGQQGGGMWTLRLSGSSQIPAGEDTTYSYDVMVQSPVSANVKLDPSIFTLAENRFEVALDRYAVQPGHQFDATLNYDAPGASLNSFVAKTAADPKWFFADSAGSLTARRDTPAARPQVAPTTIMGEPASNGARKLFALANFADKRFIDERKTGSMKLVDDGTNGDRVAGDGIYTALLPKSAIDGVYKYRLDLKALNPVLRACLWREERLSRLVAIALDPAVLAKNLVWQEVSKVPTFDPRVTAIEAQPKRTGYERRWAMFTPQDAAGNYAGIGLTDEMRFDVRDADIIGPVIDNWDGSYMVAIDHRRSEQPTVAVTYGSVTTPAVAAPAPMGVIPWWQLVFAALLFIAVMLLGLILWKVA
jgi:hypothetical protein